MCERPTSSDASTSRRPPAPWSARLARAPPGYGDVVQHADAAEDERREQQSPQVQPLAVRGLQERQVGSRRVGERRERGCPGREQAGEGQRAGRAEDGGATRPRPTLGEQDRHDRDPRRRDHREGHRRDAADHQREEDLEDHRDRQTQRQQRPHPAESADEHDRDREDQDEPAEERGAPAVAHGDVRLTLLVERGRDHRPRRRARSSRRSGSRRGPRDTPGPPGRSSVPRGSRPVRTAVEVARPGCARRSTGSGRGWLRRPGVAAATCGPIFGISPSRRIAPTAIRLGSRPAGAPEGALRHRLKPRATSLRPARRLARRRSATRRRARRITRRRFARKTHGTTRTVACRMGSDAFEVRRQRAQASGVVTRSSRLGDPPAASIAVVARDVA